MYVLITIESAETTGGSPMSQAVSLLEIKYFLLTAKAAEFGYPQPSSALRIRWIKL